MFFLTRTSQDGFSCRFAAIHLLSSEKTIEIVCRREAAKSATLLARAGVGCSKRGGLTQGRKKYAEYAEHAAEVEKKGNELKTRLLDVMDRDTEAFNVVSAAFGMPKATDEEKAARSAAIQEGLKGCTKTPMEMMELIDETLTLAQSLLGRFNDTSASDLGVAFLSLKAGIQGAWLNVLINVGSLKDQEFAAEYRAKGEALLAHALPLADECYAEIVKLIEG